VPKSQNAPRPSARTKRKQPVAAAWTPWVEMSAASLNMLPVYALTAAALGLPVEEYAVAARLGIRYFQNADYNVQLVQPPLAKRTSLSIRRRDGMPVRSRLDIRRIHAELLT
jgi:hypothetical protein